MRLPAHGVEHGVLVLEAEIAVARARERGLADLAAHAHPRKRRLDLAFQRKGELGDGEFRDVARQLGLRDGGSTSRHGAIERRRRRSRACRTPRRLQPPRAELGRSLAANCGQSLAMRILVVGGGGREHALCWAISASPLCTKLYCAPGNAGIAEEAECIDVAAEDIAGQVALASAKKIDFVVVGPEAPLVAGLVDRLAEAGIKVFGPSAKAAQLEGSKGFTKELCRRHNIPTAAYERFTEPARPRPTSRRRARRSWSRPTGSPPARAWSWPRRSTRRSRRRATCCRATASAPPAPRW